MLHEFGAFHQRGKDADFQSVWLHGFTCFMIVVGRLGSAFVGKGDLNLGVHFVDCQAEDDNEKEALLPVGWGMRDEKCTVQNS